MRFRKLAAILSLTLGAAAAATVSAAVSAAVSATGAEGAVIPNLDFLKYWSCTISSCRTTPAAAGNDVVFPVPDDVNRISVTLVSTAYVVSGPLSVTTGQPLRVRVGTTGSGVTPPFNGGATDVRNAGGLLAAAPGSDGRTSIVPSGGGSTAVTPGVTPGVTIEFSNRIPPAGSRLVSLVQKSSQQCATATVTNPDDRSTWHGLPLTLAPCAKYDLLEPQAGKQAFRLAHESGAPNDIYRLQNVDICQGHWGDAGWWDTADAKSDNGTDVVSGDYARGYSAHQLWRVVPLADNSGQVLVQQVSSGRYLDSSYGRTTAGTHLVIGGLTASDTQRWTLVPD